LSIAHLARTRSCEQCDALAEKSESFGFSNNEVFAMTKKATKKKAGRRLPTLRVHKQSQRCYGTFSGETVWFGLRSDPGTQARFDAYLAEWLVRGRKPADTRNQNDLTVRSMVGRYLLHLEDEHDAVWHANNDARFKYALDALVRLHGSTKAADYGPLKLKALREHIASAKRKDGQPKLAVVTVNERVLIIRNAFQWAASEELVPPVVIEGLRAVRQLRKSKPGVRAPRVVEPVDRASVDATLPHLSGPIAALVELMWHTGARPSELFGLCPADIDRSEKVWEAELTEHKTARKGKRRTLMFGPAAQRVIEPFLLRPANRALFRPAEAMEELRRELRANRKTPPWKSHEERYARERAERPDRVFNETYNADSFRKAVQRGVQAENAKRRRRNKKHEDREPIPMLAMWHPYRLRHAAATRIRREHGIEAARVLLGHSSATMTEVYAEADMLAAAKVVEQAG
jgi:integrase